MRASSLIVGSFLPQFELGSNINNRLLGDRSTILPRAFPVVPNYNISIPVDHFDSFNDDTYPNRFFVNDTYYKTGGPVILLDVGQVGISRSIASIVLGEHRGDSAPMRLAKKLNGLVVALEHRYYGYSRPVPMVERSGLPRAGASGYEYLTIDQALEDLAYFANKFNTTRLRYNDVVRNTSNLGPYNTPWIVMGGSYGGSRAAWSRVKHPEIFHASWASSAPMQFPFDGSILVNPIMHALPRNCTDDIAAAVKYVDGVATRTSSKAWGRIQAAVYTVTNSEESSDSISKAYDMTPFDVGIKLQYAIRVMGDYQAFGAIRTTQVMCDHLESFDVESFQIAEAAAKTDKAFVSRILSNIGDVRPSRRGVAASNSENGSYYAFAALLYGANQAARSLEYDVRRDLDLIERSTPITPKMDDQSWYWQLLSELGGFQGSNASNTDNYQVVSKYANVTAVHEILKQDLFPDFSTYNIPTRPNNTQILGWGGWNTNVSNVMFTNGEFDAWRAFSVVSQETASGAPNRTVTQRIPACNKAPNGRDVFGLVVAGAAHAQDMLTLPWPRGNVEETPPLDQGLDLFLKAWDVWGPCFNETRGGGGTRKNFEGYDDWGVQMTPSLGGVLAGMAVFLVLHLAV